MNEPKEIKWITNTSSINFLIEDEGDYPSGLNKSKYRYTLVSENYCKTQNTKIINGTGTWTHPTNKQNFNFSINEDGCYLIEAKSTDNVNKTKHHKQLVFVDSKGPKPIKTVHQPNDVWLGNNSKH